MLAQASADAAAVPAQALLGFLEDVASYAHAPETVEIVQTHISYVALAGPFVYKVKKPVDLGFADFSTLERRRHFCEEEVRLNRRLCGGIYKGVVPIFDSPKGGLTFERPGVASEEATPVEYAVKMQRLGAEDFLDRRLAEGAAGEEDLERVAEALTAFYRQQASSPEIAAWGRTARLRQSTDENFAQTKGCVGTLLGRPAYDALRYYTNRFYDQQATRINRRRAGGRILDGHGDLRLEHVHLSPADVCIFDGIEFSERLRAVDVACDVAFLAMDLDAHGHPDLALFFARRMAERLGDPGLLQMMDFYKCYRAYVRGKVEHLRAGEAEVPEADRTESRERARRHFQLALQYATAGSGPAVLAVMGGIGTGKSTQARALGKALGWAVVRSDVVRKEQAGMPLRARPAAAQREALYAPERTEHTYAALREEALRWVADGHGAVLDATFGKRAHRDALRDALGAAGVPYCFIEMVAPGPVVRERLQRREAGPPPVSDARLEDFEKLQAGYEAPDALEDAYHFTVSAGEAPEAATTTAILKHLVRFELRHQPRGAPA